MTRFKIEYYVKNDLNDITSKYKLQLKRITEYQVYVVTETKTVT